jgi:hypothetical protein
MRGRLMRAGKKSPVQDIRGYFPGTVVDRVMRTWLDSDSPQPGAMVGMVDQIMAVEEEKAKQRQDGVVRWRSKTDRQDVAQFCRELVGRLEPILKAEVLPYDYEPAKWFDVPVRIPGLDGQPTEIALIGEMDILVNDGDWAVWDLKGTKDDNYWRKTLGQLTFYSLAVQHMFGQPAFKTGLIQPMCAERVKPVAVSDEDRMLLMSRVVRMAQEVWAGQDRSFREQDGGCFNPFPCQVRHACPRLKAGQLILAGRGVSVDSEVRESVGSKA